MRELIYSVVGSLMAAMILLAVPSVSRYFLRDNVYLDVDVCTDQYDTLYVSRITARNSSQYGFAPIRFASKSSGTILRLAVRQYGGAKVVSTDGTNRLASPLSIGAGETVELLEIDEGGPITTEPQRLFVGEYTSTGARGLPEKRAVRVRTMAEAQLSLYRLVAKAVGGFVVLVTLGTGALLLRKKLKNRNSNKAP